MDDAEHALQMHRVAYWVQVFGCLSHGKTMYTPALFFTMDAQGTPNPGRDLTYMSLGETLTSSPEAVLRTALRKINQRDTTILVLLYKLDAKGDLLTSGAGHPPTNFLVYLCSRAKTNRWDYCRRRIVVHDGHPTFVQDENLPFDNRIKGPVLEESPISSNDEYVEARVLH